VSANVSPIPKGYHSVTPMLMVRGAAREIDFLKQAFGATEKGRHAAPDGSVMHAEVQIGDSIIMLGDAKGDCQPTTVALYLYVPNVDEIYQRAVRAGGKSEMELADQFWGDRSGSLTDPAGNHWWIATHKEDVSADELARRAQKFFAQHQVEQRKAA
jgi:PhnB protein